MRFPNFNFLTFETASSSLSNPSSGPSVSSESEVEFELFSIISDFGSFREVCSSDLGSFRENSSSDLRSFLEVSISGFGSFLVTSTSDFWSCLDVSISDSASFSFEISSFIDCPSPSSFPLTSSKTNLIKKNCCF